MSNVSGVPEELNVGRSDPVYMAHGYLTKVPVPAIVPFLEEYTKPGDVVLDPFAGSGMTGVAALATGRSARLFDISVLGRHIGTNYVRLVDSDLLRKSANEVVEGVRESLGSVYATECLKCGREAELAKTVWSFVFECGACKTAVTYYDALAEAGWSKPEMQCPTCRGSVTARLRRIGESPVLDYVVCECSRTQLEQKPSQPSLNLDIEALPYPRVEITADRQMYKASALGKHGMTTVASFYSTRNLAVLTVLRGQIAAVEDDDIREKLLFAFTASLTRASKRYQWSKQRPLNAANANYYVAPVFYEWNVFDLFLRKVEALVKSDDWLRCEVAQHPQAQEATVNYDIASAEALPVDDDSVDYVFTDPPFGSNLFYADMALFQEAWLDDFTDVSREAVVDRGTKKSRDASRYETLLTSALEECRRVVRPHGRISMVFGNSTGAMWALVQRAVANAGLVVEADRLVVLNKGQRSVKGLASGFEHVATLDLILTMRAADDAVPPSHVPTHDDVASVVQQLAGDAAGQSPSHLYLELLRHGIRANWDLSRLHLRAVTDSLIQGGWALDSRTGRLVASNADGACDDG